MEAPGRGSNGDSRGLNRVLRSFAYAWEGLSYVYSTQANMRIHVLFAALAGGACIAAGVGRVEVLMVTMAIAGVLVAETVNTVAESMTDLLEPHQSPVAKIIKDVAAAGVLISATFSVFIAVLVFYPALSDFPERLQAFLERRLPYFAAYLVLAILPALAGLVRPFRSGLGRK